MLNWLRNCLLLGCSVFFIQAYAAVVLLGDTGLNELAARSMKKPLLVMLESDGCYQCATMRDRLVEIDQDFGGAIEVAVASPSNLSFDTFGMPLLLLYQNGNQLFSLAGAYPVVRIEMIIRQLLSY